MAIVSFKCQKTLDLFEGRSAAKWSSIERVALRKLTQLAVSQRLSDLNCPPGNRLESLAGNRSGQHSIRINKQWRICFVWTSEGAKAVEIVDYH